MWGRSIGKVEREEIVDWGRGCRCGVRWVRGVPGVRGGLRVRLGLRERRRRAPVVQPARARLHQQLHLRYVHELVAIAATAQLLVLRPTHRDHREHRTSASPHRPVHTTVRDSIARTLTLTATFCTPRSVFAPARAPVATVHTKFHVN